jgi:hypothetical protein
MGKQIGSFTVTRTFTYLSIFVWGEALCWSTNKFIVLCAARKLVIETIFFMYWLSILRHCVQCVLCVI